MILKELQLKAFGLFDDVSISFGQGFTLIYGPNEAGKSTVLRAITDFFYGIPNQSPDTYQHHPRSMRIEALLQDSRGEEYRFIRRKGRKNTLSTAEQESLPDNLLEKYTGTISREQFSLMFGMNHESLRKGGEDLLQGKGALGEALFEAASGIGSLREVFLELEEKSRNLYKPSGLNPPMNRTAKEYHQLRETINDCSLIPRSFLELEKRYQEEQKKLEQMRQARRRYKEEIIRLERKKNTLPLLARRKKIREQMRELGDTPLLPPSFPEKRIALMEKRGTAQTILQKAKQELKELQEKMENLQISPDLLEQADAIAALQERLDTYRSNCNNIPLWTGEMQELEAGAFSLLQQIDPAFSHLEEADSLQRSLCQVETLKKLIREYPLLKERWRGAQKKVEDLEGSWERLKKKMAALGPSIDATSLKGTIDKIRKKGHLDESHATLAYTKKGLQREIQAHIKALGLWSGSLEEFRSLSLPLPETLDSFGEEFQELYRKREQLQEKEQEEEEKQQSFQDQMLQDERSRVVPTVEQLEKARVHRQWGWHLVRRSWLDNASSPEEEKRFHPQHPLPMAYEMSVAQADEIADALRLEAKGVERKMMLQEEMKRSTQRMEIYRSSQVELEKKGEELQKRWLDLWAETGIIPRSPGEMMAWLGRCQEIQGKIQQLDAIQLEQEKIEADLLQGRRELDEELRRLQETPVGPDETLEEALDRAQKRWDEIFTRNTEEKSMADTLLDMQDEVLRAQEERDDTSESLQLFWQDWKKALQQIHLSEDTAVEVAAAYLEKTEGVLEKRREMAVKRAALDQIKQYNQDFEAEITQLLERVAPDLVHLPPEQGAIKLRTRADEARQDQRVWEDLLREREKVIQEKKEGQTLLTEANQGIALLVNQALCRDESQLKAVEERSMRLQTLQEEQDRLEDQILSLGAGLSLEAMEAEAEDGKGHLLPAQLDELNESLQEMEGELEAVNQSFGAIQKEYEEKKKGTSLEALEAAQKAQGVLARLQSQTEEYLRLRLAARLLHQGIERYREENQNPIIEQAGSLFSHLTHGSFATIQVDFDEKDNPVLVGVRSSHEEVPVPGMSDGTLDQLYLALRLASLSRYLQEHEPLPFILDDLLVNFDHVRSQKTLEVLGHLSQQNQFLFFTHHQGLVEAAQEAIPRERLQISYLSSS